MEKDRLSKLLDTVIEVPLLKSFFVVKNPWWQEDIPNVEVSNLPARELHYYKQGNLGNVMVYADRPYINFWSKYSSQNYQEAAEISDKKELRKVFARHVHIDPKDIINCGIRNWSCPPYGAACHLWRPGVQSWEVIDKLLSFSLNPAKCS